MLAAVLATVLFSLSAVAARRTTVYLGGTEANFCRLVLAAILLTTVAHVFGPGLKPFLHPQIFWLLMLSGAIGFGLGDVALFQALPRIGSRLTTLIIHCVSVPLAAGVEFAWLGVRPSWVQILCAVTIISGVAVALAPRENSHLSPATRWAGIGWALGAAIGQGFGAGVLSRVIYDLAARMDLPLAGFFAGLAVALQRQLGGIVVTGLLLLALRAWLERHPDSPGARNLTNPDSQWRAGIPWLSLHALCGPAIGVACFQWALIENPTGVVLPIVATTPLVIIPFAIYLKEETPSWRSVLGGVVAVAGVVAMLLLSSSA